MGAPLGNHNEAKGKAWSGALRAALAQFEEGEVKAGQALREIAVGVVRRAVAGDKDAVKEIGERLDGKAVQAIAGVSDEPLVVKLVRFADTE